MSLCALCAATGKTCCQQSDILITGGDLQRVRTYLGRSDFYEHRPPRDPGNLGDEGDPNWLAYTILPEGTRRVLRHTSAGDCLFLSPTGCLLPAEVRPLICRLHPVTYNEAGITGVSPECPSHLAEAGLETLQAIGMDLRVARRWHAQLYQELRQDFRPVDRAA